MASVCTHVGVIHAHCLPTWRPSYLLATKYTQGFFCATPSLATASKLQQAFTNQSGYPHFAETVYKLI